MKKIKIFLIEFQFIQGELIIDNTWVRDRFGGLRNCSFYNLMQDYLKQQL